MENIIDIVTLFVAAGGALFGYFKFFREGTHHQRIEFDLELQDLGVVGEERVVEVSCFAVNKGNVEQRFEKIIVKLRGIEGEPISMLQGHEPRLSFPLEIAKASLISENWNYYFVRPKVKQNFPLVVTVPVTCTILWARATFRYHGSGDLHSAERAFKLSSEMA